MAAIRTTASVHRGGPARRSVVGLLAVLVVAVALWSTSRGEAVDPPRPQDEASGRGRSDPTGPTDSSPPAVLAAERHLAQPGAASLRNLVEAIGGMDALVVGRAEGAFDLVRFDPVDEDRLIASRRSSYGQAENHEINEIWRIDAEGLTQDLLAPTTPHDFAHFNRDGTITMWTRAGDDAGFAPRRAAVLGADRRTIAVTAPLFASRFVAVAGAVFALTGDGDYYSTSATYERLIVDGQDRRTLDRGAPYGWIDTPIPELLIAYPREQDGTTAVWNTNTLEPLDDHPLGGRHYQRVAMSGDRRLAIGVRFDGSMEQLDLGTGRVLGTFGQVDPSEIDQPVTINHDGTTAVTVDRSGEVTLWWVGDDAPIASVQAEAAQPRWVAAQYGPRSASAVAASAERLALRFPARPGLPTTWTIVDIGVDHLIAQACDDAGRAPATQRGLGAEGQGPVEVCR